MSSGLYPGVGAPMYRANDNFLQEPKWLSMRVADPVIPDDKYSVPAPLNVGIKTIISVIFDTAPTTDAFEIWVSLKGDMSDEYIVASIPATTDTTYQWTSTAYLTGCARIRNKGTADILEAFIQPLATTAI